MVTDHVTRVCVFPFYSRVRAFIFVAHRDQHVPTFFARFTPLGFHRVVLTHALALPGGQFSSQEKFPASTTSSICTRGDSNPRH